MKSPAAAYERLTLCTLSGRDRRFTGVIHSEPALRGSFITTLTPPMWGAVRRATGNRPAWPVRARRVIATRPCRQWSRLGSLYVCGLRAGQARGLLASDGAEELAGFFFW